MRYLMIFMMLWASLCVKAQQTTRKVEIVGRVYDKFTEMYVPNTKTTLMTTDSVVVDTAHVGINRLNNVSLTTYYLFKAPARVGKYIIKLEHPRYQTCYLNYEIKRLGRQTQFSGPDAKMQIARKNGGLHGENELGEVTIKATKVQFFYKGDTLVYNADAFNLPEGSMLDALIRQMPGARLTEDGQIFIHEKKVDYLTLNGKKMFGDNGQILLQNLPHYTVKDIKVFEQNEEHQIGTGVESLKKDYVMDVSLKREYDKRNFGQVELGVGTKDRKIGRLFDSYNRESLMVMGFANLNNVNQTREPGRDGSFSDSDSPRSIVDNKQFALSVSKEKSHGNFSNVLGIIGTVRKNNTEFSQSQETHLAGSSAYKNIQEQQYNRLSSLTARNRLIFRKPFFFSSTTDVDYNDGKNNLSNASEAYDNFLNSGNIVNDAILQRYGNNHSLRLNQNMMVYKRMSWGDDFAVKANMCYNEGKNKREEKQRIVYPKANIDSLYEYIANENVHTKEYELQGLTQYKFNFLGGAGIAIEYGYTQKYTGKERYRLKNLISDNEYNSHTLHREHQPGIELSYQKNKLTVTSGFRLKLINERMNYHREDLDTLIHKDYTDIFPDLRIMWNFGCSSLEFYNKYNSYQKPAVSDLVEKVDDSDPLVMTKGKGNLKKVRMYDYQLWYNYRGSKQDFVVSFSSQSQFMFDNICRAMLYDESTGSYLLVPYNVGYTWYLNNNLQVGMALNKAKNIKLQSNLKYMPSMQIDLAGTTQTGLQRNKYIIHSVEEGISLSYQYKKATWRIEGALKYQGNRCGTNTNANYDAWDYHYGLNVSCYFPWEFQFAGDIGMFSRKGYSWDVLNKDNLISNVSLSRAFCKSKLLVKIKAFDIFHQLTSIERRDLASRVEETNYNCIPRYGMLSVTYRFGKK